MFKAIKGFAAGKDSPISEETVAPARGGVKSLIDRWSKKASPKKMETAPSATRGVRSLFGGKLAGAKGFSGK